MIFFLLVEFDETFSHWNDKLRAIVREFGSGYMWTHFNFYVGLFKSANQDWLWSNSYRNLNSIAAKGLWSKNVREFNCAKVSERLNSQSKIHLKQVPCSMKLSIVCEKN